MAKNYNDVKLSDLSLHGARTQEYEGTFTGSFIGDLTGNADTATSLAKPLTVTITGDAAGSFTTAGKSAQLKLTVNKAAEASHALTADSAINVQLAQKAATADFATNAGNANSAGKASVADNAAHAKFADEATQSSRAAYADKSAETDHALTADRAIKADSASTADRALVAEKLVNADAPVKLAERAKLAHVADIGRYDCMGRSFTDYYALKSELEPYKDMLTIKQANALFVPREEQVLTATVKGRAIGRGVLHGNNLEIIVESVTSCGAGDSSNIYCNVLYTFLPDRPDVNGDTTKIYLDPLGNLHLWNQDAREWQTVTSPLDEETSHDLDTMRSEIKALINQFDVKLSNMVTIDGMQTIDGAKTFSKLIESPIADINTDPARTVATIHNVRDVRDHLRSEMHIGYHHILDQITNIKEELDAQARGDILMGGKDYTIYANQEEMVPSTLYLNYLDKDKVYIPADPETWAPLDPSKEIVYIRTLVKVKTGHVTWWDKRCIIDPNVWVPWYVDLLGKKHLLIEQGHSLYSSDIDGINKNLVSLDVDGSVQAGDIHNVFNINALDNVVTINGNEVVCTVDKLDKYMPKTGGEFTGSISVPNLHQSTSDERVINSFTVHKLINEEIAKFNNNLNIHKYMPKAGGTFTGKITVPQSINLTLASDLDVLNKGDVLQLLDMGITNSEYLKLEFCDTTPECVERMQPNVLYSTPVHDFWKDSDIHSIRLEPDDSANIIPSDNEGVIYGEKDKL